MLKMKKKHMRAILNSNSLTLFRLNQTTMPKYILRQSSKYKVY